MIRNMIEQFYLAKDINIRYLKRDLVIIILGETKQIYLTESI